jgi:tetratricopeptide (TPR) repeat protein
MYRARKFVQRHRGGVALTTLFLLGIFASLGLALWQARIARNEAQRANTVRDFLVGVFDAARAHLPRDQRPTPEALVEQAQRNLDGIEGLDVATHADLLRTLGEVELSLANYSRAEQLFQQASMLTVSRPQADQELRVLRADALQRAGRNAQAVTLLEPALADLRRTPAPTLVRALGVVAAAQMGDGHPDAAITYRREAQASARSVYGEHSAEALAAGFETGNTLAQAEFFGEAAAMLPPLLEAWRASRAPQDDRYIAALASLAAASDGLGDKPATEAHYRELLALKRAIYTAPHDAIARTLRDLGGIVARSEHYSEAEALLNEALAMQKQVFGQYHSEIVATYNALGEVMASQRRFDAAQTFYRSAISVCDAGAIKEETCPVAHNDLGMSLYRQDKLDAAQAEMQEALRERRALFGDDHPTVAYSLSTLANVAVKQGNFSDAVRLIAQSLDVLERTGRGGSREGALIRHGYAQALWKVERDADALREIDRAIADWNHIAPRAKARHVMMLVQKAQILQSLKQPEQARATADAAIALGAEASELGPSTKNLLRQISGRADVYPADAVAQ